MPCSLTRASDSFRLSADYAAYLSVREAARQLGIPKTTLARYLDAGKEECRGYHLKFCRQLQNENEQPLKPI